LWARGGPSHANLRAWQVGVKAIVRLSANLRPSPAYAGEVVSVMMIVAPDASRRRLASLGDHHIIFMLCGLLALDGSRIGDAGVLGCRWM